MFLQHLRKRLKEENYHKIRINMHRVLEAREQIETDQRTMEQEKFYKKIIKFIKKVLKID